MSSTDHRVKVLLISGFWRSGSTILTRIFNELNGTFAAGELKMIWKYSYQDNGRCGCGNPFRDCQIWQDVTNHAFGGFDEAPARQMIEREPRMRDMPSMLLPGGTSRVRQRFGDYIDTLDRLYSSIGTMTGARVIVDSSKPPQYAHIMTLVPSVDLYVIHLVRDPRGVQYSILRRRDNGDPRFQQHSVTRSALMWNALNVSQELVGAKAGVHYLRLRYEDFVRNPTNAMTRIGAFINEPDLGVPTFENGNVLLSTNHTVNGSDNRTEIGAVPFRRDDAWTTRMDPHQRATVSRLTYPMLYHYGYHATNEPRRQSHTTPIVSSAADEAKVSRTGTSRSQR